MGSPLSAWSSLVSLFLVFWVGSAWFAAMHPREFRKCLRAIGVAGRPDEAEASLTVVRLVGLVYAAAGLLLLELPYIW